MKTYRCKHAVEAMRWTDTDESREAFAAWFDNHDAPFETRGSEVVLPEGEVVTEGEWIIALADGAFLVMADEGFTALFKEGA